MPRRSYSNFSFLSFFSLILVCSFTTILSSSSTLENSFHLSPSRGGSEESFTWKYEEAGVRIQAQLNSSQVLLIYFAESTAMDFIGVWEESAQVRIEDLYNTTQNKELHLDKCKSNCSDNLEDVNLKQSKHLFLVSFLRKYDSGDDCDMPIYKGHPIYFHFADKKEVIINLTCHHILKDMKDDNGDEFHIDLNDWFSSNERIAWTAIGVFCISIFFISSVLDDLKWRFRFVTFPPSNGFIFKRAIVFVLLVSLCALIWYLSFFLTSVNADPLNQTTKMHIMLFFCFLALAFQLLYFTLMRPGFLIFFMRRRFYCWNLFSISVGEIILISFWIGCNLRWFFVWFSSSQDTGLIRYAKAIGHVNELNISVLILPVTQNSIWTTFFGIPFENSITYHKWLACTVYTITVIHMSLWWILWGQKGTLVQCAFKMGCSRGILQGELALLIATIIIIFALDWFRRNKFEVFYIIHHLFLAFFAMALYHSWMVGGYLMVYVLFSGILYLVDRLIRTIRGRIKKSVVLEFRREISQVTYMKIHQSGFRWLPGQYVFLNVPMISSFEWHPFSISSIPGEAEGVFTLHIKDMGVDTWSHKMTILARQRGLSPQYYPAILVDGPYGSPTPAIYQFEEVLLVAGGIGITPVITFLESLLERSRRISSVTKKITFLWVVKQPLSLLWFKSALGRLTDSSENEFSDLIINVKLHVTASPMEIHGEVDSGLYYSIYSPLIDNSQSNSSDVSLPDLPTYKIGRPNFFDLCDEIVYQAQSENKSTKHIGVLACGPEDLVHCLQDACKLYESHHVRFSIFNYNFRL